MDIKKQQLYTLEDYYVLPEERRVELIDGVFYDMAAPTDVQLDQDDYTMVQPDVFVVCDRSKVTESHIMGAPDYIAEVLSKATRKKDMSKKLAKYEAAGVREYWMIPFQFIFLTKHVKLISRESGRSFSSTAFLK